MKSNRYLHHGADLQHQNLCVQEHAKSDTCFQTSRTLNGPKHITKSMVTFISTALAFRTWSMFSLVNDLYLHHGADFQNQPYGGQEHAERDTCSQACRTTSIGSKRNS